MSLLPNTGLPDTYTDTITPYAGADIETLHKVVDSQPFGLMRLLGPGVDTIFSPNSWKVTIGSGLSVNIAEGQGIIGDNTAGYGFGYKGASTLGSLTASSTLYIFAALDARVGVNVTRQTGTPIFLFDTVPTHAGGILLASATTSGSAVTAVTDLRKAIQLDKAFRLQGAYDNAVTYGPNDVVTSAGNLWYALQSTVGHSPAVGAYWAQLGGGSGGGGPLSWTGDWANATTYVVDDAVQNNNPTSSYRCIADHTSGASTEPGVGASWQTVWQYIARAGDTGSTGASGTNGLGYGGTSATSLAIGTGTKTFTTQADLAYAIGSRVHAASAADGANYMEGTVLSYSGTSLALAVILVGGSGTFTDWTFSVAGQPGNDGTGWVDANKGAWDGATAYVAGDVVEDNGASYTCILGHTNHEPPNGTYWQLLADKGAPGVLATDPHLWTKLQQLPSWATPQGAAITLTADEPQLDPTLGGTVPFASWVSIKQGTPGFTIFGIKDPGAEQVLTIANESGFPLTIAYDSASATFAANHVILAGAVDLVLGLRQSVTFRFNDHSWASGSSTTSRWVQIGIGGVSSTPSGAAGGDLAGSYPSPTVKASVALSGNPTAATQSPSNNSTRIATTAYVDAADALKAPLASPALTGNPTATTQSAGNNSTRLATTAYADGAVSTEATARDAAIAAALAGQNARNDCRMSSPTAIVGTYANGSSGVGATFTATATGVLTIDGVTPLLGDRVALLAQTSALQNGIYTVTTLGALGISLVLTRATDYDTPAEVGVGTYFIVQLGTANAGTIWYQGTTITAIGTDAFTFTEVAGAATGTASGDLSGTYPAPTVAKINGVAVTGTPSTGDVITATGSSAATWQAPSGSAVDTVQNILAGQIFS